MIIQCPACRTKFKINEKLFGKKRIVKFQCSKCKTIFKFDRETGKPIQRDEELTMPAVPSMLPIERKSVPRPPVMKSQPRISEADKDLEAATTEYKKEEKVIEESYESFEPEPPPPKPQPQPEPSAAAAVAVAEEKVSAAGAEEAAEAEADRPSAPAQSAVPPPPPPPLYPPGEMKTPKQPIPAVEVPREPAEPMQVEMPEEPEEELQAEELILAQPKTTLPPAASSASGSARKILTSDLYVLELEHELAEKQLVVSSSRARAAGLVTLVVVLVCALLYIYMSWRNDWDFAALFNNPAEAFAVAIGQKTKLKIAPDAKGLETAVTEVYSTETANGIRVLVVQGEVLNTTVFPKKQIRVYIELKNFTDQVIDTKETLSGLTLLTRRQVEEKTLSGLTMHLEAERKTADEWIVNSNRKVSFQAFFTDAPSGAEDPDRFSISATAVSAVNALGQ